MNKPEQTRERESELLESASELVPIKVEAAQVRQRVIAALRRAIELGTLKAGERLIEKDLCAKLSVSRTSLREALRDLEANGIVTNLSVRGLVITPLSRDEAINMSRVRGALEVLVAEQFIRYASDDDIAELRAALERLRAAEPFSGATLDAQRDYYQVWCKGARNPFVFNLLMNIQLRLSVIRSGSLRKPELRAQNMAEREAILRCMERRDLAAAELAVRSHVKNAAMAAIEDSESSCGESKRL